MTEAKRPRSSKGVFTRVNLPVARRYPIPLNRNWGLVGGLCVGLLIGGLALLNIWQGDSTWMSGGPLSSVHAAPDRNCQDCHTPFSGVEETKCRACHEKSPPGSKDFSFQAHTQQFANDPEPTMSPRAVEMSCAKCHPEHRGRQVSPLLALDDPCLECHQLRSFETDHPPFAVLGGSRESSLFQHALHLSEIYGDTDSETVASACYDCHILQADRKGFALVPFAELCEICHTPEEVSVPDEALPFYEKVEFSHRPHLIGPGCLDCHQESVEEGFGEPVIPPIEKCRTCHNRERSTEQCGLCHRFHPAQNDPTRSALDDRFRNNVSIVGGSESGRG